MSHAEKLAAIRAAGKEAGQGFSVPLDVRVYATGSKSHTTPYVIVGPVGGVPGDNIACYTAEALWNVLFAIPVKPEVKTLFSEEQRKALVNSILAGDVQLEVDRQVKLGELQPGDITRHADGKLRIAISLQKQGWRMMELATGKMLNRWHLTTNATLMRQVKTA